MVFQTWSANGRTGPLGMAWIAATQDRQLKRHQIIEADIGTSVDLVLSNEAPQLRVSSQLLLGLAKIFNRKVIYLYEECNDALGSIKEVAQRPSPGKANEKADKNAKTKSRAVLPPVHLPDNFELEDIATTVTQPTADIPHMDLRMGPSTSMADGRQTDILFGSTYLSDFDAQFDMDGDKYDLSVEDLFVMQGEGWVPNNGDNPAGGASGPEAAAEEVCEFHIDLGFRFDDAELPEAATATPAPPEDPAAAEPSGAAAPGGQEEAAANADGAQNADAPADAQEAADVRDAQEVPQNEDATQPTQSEPATQTEDAFTQEEPVTQGEPATQETEDGRKPRRGSRRNAAARDTPLPTRELRRRRSTAADSDVGSQAEAGSQVEPGSSQQSASSRGSQRADRDKLAKSRKNTIVDIDEKSQKPVVILPGALQRKLLEDRSAIMTERGKRQKLSEPSANGSLMKRHGGPLYWPGVKLDLPVALQQLYCIGMEILDVRDVARSQHADKKSTHKPQEEEQAPTEQHDQPTNTAEPTNTDININEHSSHEQHPPITPASAPNLSHQSHQDHYHDEDPSVQPTPEVARVEEREQAEPSVDMEATPSAPAPAQNGDEVETAPNTDQAAHHQEESCQDAADHEHPGQHKRHREAPVYEDLGEPLPPHVSTDLTTGGVDDDAEAANDTVTAKSFTRRTRVVVAAIKAAVDHADKGKKKKMNNSEAQPAPKTLHLSSFVKDHNRLHASRWFFELLVLKAKGVVELDQVNPYADVAIQATPKLADVTAS